MSSSTSSSEGGRPLSRPALLFVAGALLLVAIMEVFTRRALVPRSKDLRRFRGYAERATELVQTPAYRIALVGNSATDRGVDSEALSRELGEATGRPVRAEKFVADASRINTWHFLMKSFFWDRNVEPDLVVVTYYEAELEDGNPIEIGRVAQYMTSLSDVPDVFSLDLPETDQRVEFLLSSVWATYAFRSRVRERTWEVVMPGYPEFVQQVNDTNRDHARRENRARNRKPITLRALDRFLALAKEHGTHLVFVAYPTAPTEKPYEPQPEEVAKIRAAGAELLDLRATPGLNAASYADDVHLTPEAAQVYTRYLATRLAELVPRGSGARAGASPGP